MNTFWYISIFISLLLFLYGFFPVKNPKSCNVLKPPTTIQNIKIDPSELYQPKVDRVILFIIDALRVDFINNKSMPFVSSLLNEDDNCFLQTKVESPTVTLPRIKAITTGSVPQFIDIVYNFASNKIKEDSFLQRAKDLNKSIVFYGDDTWIRLYPNMFLRSEGTTSFYVTDYTEVDNNVTRHIDKELKNEDWTILITHYLGLDHIGHMYGPFSPLIHIKLLEMDNIIKHIYKKIQKQNYQTVVVVCGDHGMKDSGGHGGSSRAETIVPLIFLGMGCDSKGKPIRQTDIASTISTILGIPLPAHSIGTTLPAILVNYNINEALYIQYYNSLNLLEKYKSFYPDFESIHKSHADYLTNKSEEKSWDLFEQYEVKLSETSEKLIKITTKQNVPLLYISLCLMICCMLKLLLPFYAKNAYYVIVLLWILLSLELIVLRTKLFFTLTTAVTMTTGLVFINIKRLYELFKNYITKESTETKLISIGTVVRTLLMASSSFVEEEHQIWYFFWGTFLAVKAKHSYRESKSEFCVSIICFATVRFVRTLNQVGDKWAHIPDLSDWLNRSENITFLQIFYLIGMCGALVCCWNNKGSVTNFLLIPTFSFIISYGFTESVLAIYFSRAMIILLFSLHVYETRKLSLKIFKTMWILWCISLLRHHNIILIPLCCYFAKYLNTNTSGQSIHCKTLLHMWLSMMMMYAQGVCNSLASIDVAPGYVGLQNYYPIITAIQIVSHMYTFPILSYMLLYENYYKTRHKKVTYQVSKSKMFNTLVMYQVFNLICLYIFMLIQRNHLFIWTVFAPKLLMESLYTFILLIIAIIFNFNVSKKIKLALTSPSFFTRV